MGIPDSFHELTLQFHQDFNEVHDGDDPIDYILDGLGDQTKADLKIYLTELLARSPSGAELQELWREGDADWSFREEDLRQILTMVRDRIPA